MLNCSEVTHLCSESQERQLSFKENMSLKMHTMMCSGCRNFREQMHTLRTAMHAFAKGADERHDRTGE